MKGPISRLKLTEIIFTHQILLDYFKLEMWANDQRDGHPDEHRWHPLFNTTVWLTPTTRVPCSNAAKTRNPLKFAGVPKLLNRSQPLVDQSSPYCEDVWDTLLFNKFLPRDAMLARY